MLGKIIKILELKIRDIIFELFIKKKMKKGDKILVTSVDGIGDFVIRDKLFSEIIKKHGAEKIVVIIKPVIKELILKYGILEENIIVIDRKRFKKVWHSYGVLNEIASFPIGRVYFTEFGKKSKMWFIKYLDKNIEKVGFYDAAGSSKYFTKVLKGGDPTTVLGGVIVYLREVFNKELTKEGARPDIGNFYEVDKKYTDGISFGIGSIAKKKMMCSKRLSEILIEILKEYPDEKIYLLGRGEFENKLIGELKELLESNKNLINLVGKTSLDETNRIIKSTKLYIGMDSGLYNTAFAMRQKTIGLFTEITPFAHVGFKDVVILVGKDGEKDYFGNENLNGIKVQDVLEAIKSLRAVN